MEDNKLHLQNVKLILKALDYIEDTLFLSEYTHYRSTRDKIIRIQHQLEAEKDDFHRGKELGYAMGYHAATKGEPPKYDLGEWLDDCDSSN